MVDDTPQAAEPSPPVAAPVSPPHKTRNKALTIALLLILIPGVVIVLWIWVTLGYTYSSGERAGYMQKMSKKGWICKRWVGEIAETPFPCGQPLVLDCTVMHD